MWISTSRSWIWSLRGFHTGAGGCLMRLRGTRGRGPRGLPSGGGSYLLEKFVKQFVANGSLVVRSPFNVKVRGSYFDKSNNVDRLKNKRVSEEIFSESISKETEEWNLSNLDSEGHDEDQNRALSSSLIEKLSQTLEAVQPSGTSSLSKTPLHLLIYGRLHHRLDSYSIIDCSQKQDSHVYLTDANTFVEAESMLTHALESTSSSPPPDALFTLLTPNPTHKAESNVKLKDLLESSKIAGESLSSCIKLYAAKHILDSNAGIKTVFLVPTLMGKIYLQGESGSNLELDSSLIHKVDSVGLHTDFGNISIRDLVADEIRLASHMGDIISEGSLDGHVVVETSNDGDFLASHVDGPSLLVTTDDGDINVLGCVNSDVSQFYTRNGNIYVRNLSNQCYMLVRETGSISASVDDGFLTAVVKNGSIHLRIDSLTADSSLQVENGEITLKIPKDRNFRINAIAQHTNLSPQIANQGDLSINEDTLHETFKIEPSYKSSSHLPSPVLKVEVLQGTLNLSLIPEDEESSSSKKSESRKNP